VTSCQFHGGVLPMIFWIVGFLDLWVLVRIPRFPGFCRDTF
jgi:hypothetical protein